MYSNSQPCCGMAVTSCQSASLRELANIDPESTLRAAYCHRVIRHAALWLQSGISTANAANADEQVDILPGTCSNPNPLNAIRDVPIAHIDVAWYMLAQAEVASGVDLGITANLNERLADGPILSLELALRTQLIQTEIERQNAVGFATHFKTYVETTAFYAQNRQRIKQSFDVFNPQRESVPTLTGNPPFSPHEERVANDAIIAFAVRAAVGDAPNAMTDLRHALDSRFGAPFPGLTAFDYSESAPAEPDTLDQAVLDSLSGRHLYS